MVLSHKCFFAGCVKAAISKRVFGVNPWKNFCEQCRSEIFIGLLWDESFFCCFGGQRYGRRAGHRNAFRIESRKCYGRKQKNKGRKTNFVECVSKISLQHAASRSARGIFCRFHRLNSSSIRPRVFGMRDALSASLPCERRTATMVDVEPPLECSLATSHAMY